MEHNEGPRMESVYSTKVRAGRRRTYFFDVRQTKGNDYYITLTESTKRFNGEGYNRHKLFLYKEDFNRFLKGLEEVINHIKTDLMPDFDYELYEKRQEEWEAQMKAEQEVAASQTSEPETVEETADDTPADESDETTENDETTESDETTEEADASEEGDAGETESEESETTESEDDISW